MTSTTSTSANMSSSTGNEGTTMTFQDGPPEVRFRKGGPKEVRLNRVRLMETGRYFEAAIARNEKPGDIDNMHSLRVSNLPTMQTTEAQIRAEFEVFGQLGDVYRPIDKDTKRPLSFFFVRYYYRQHMINAMNELNGKVINGRPMKITEARPGRFLLETQVY